MSDSRQNSSLGSLLDDLYRRFPWDQLRKLASRPRLAIAILGAIAFFGAAAQGFLEGIPEPAVHDEFAYLLQADTYASGRLTNPTHPFWPHFETFHVIHQPTYSGKYPPAQGMVLAIGKGLGHPIIGVWLGLAAMVASITWMLMVWVPDRWALVGGLIVILQLGIDTYWSQSYWGGAVAATGAALLYGGLRRLLDSPRLAPGVLFGAGLGILAASRPFEGLLVSIPALVVLAWRGFRDRDRSLLTLGILPSSLVIATVLLGIGYYNFRVTGDPARMPYQVHEEQYASIPNFLWGEPRTGMDYRHESIERYWQTWGIERFEAMRHPVAWTSISAGKLFRNLLFFLGPGLVLILIIPRVIRDRWILFAILISAGILFVTLLTPGSYPHYVAPAAPLLYVFVAAALSSLEDVQTGLVVGHRWIVLVILFFFIMASWRILDRPAESDFVVQRASVEQRLESLPGRDLVIVRYDRGHNVHHEWVYNRADIDSAEIVWARDMGPRQNRELRKYFADRNIWSLTVADDPVLDPLSLVDSIERPVIE